MSNAAGASRRRASSARIHSSSRTPSGGVERPAAPEDAALEVGHRALLLGPLRDRQHDVGERAPSRRGRSRRRRAGRAGRARRAPSATFGDDTTRFDPCTSSARTPPGAPSDCSSSTAGTPGPGMTSGSTPHTARDVGARLGVGDLAVAGELVALLAVLAAALAVALTGERAVAAARRARAGRGAARG